MCNNGSIELIENMVLEEFFADILLVTDEKGFAQHVKLYRKDKKFFEPEEIIGKHILEIYPSIKAEESTLLKALRGEPTISTLTTQVTFHGQICILLENTFPIKKNGKIAGAISFAKYANYFRSDNSFPKASSEKRHTLYEVTDIVGKSFSIKKLREQIIYTAQSNSDILIYGETGTGKEMVAQSIHTASNRKNKVFLSQNCSAIPANLLESMLFGSTKGIYTGAEDRPGIFEIVDGGTIFLDEINSMDLNMQTKILKVLEDRQVTRIGSATPTPVDVRIISAINEEPLECLASGKLRKDLFYRLSAVILEVPTLKDRSDDILLLTEYFIESFSKEMKREVKGISPEVEEFFIDYDWPGNVRELRNVIESAFNFVQGNVINLSDLPSYMTKYRDVIFDKDVEKDEKQFYYKPSDCKDLNEAIEKYEKEFIMESINRATNMTRLAKRLRISRQTLSYKLKKYDIKLPYKDT